MDSAALKYFASLFNIKLDNPMIAEDIGEIVSGVPDIKAFRSWIRDNLNHYDTQYLSGLPKLATMAKIFNKNYVRTNATGRLEKARGFMEALAEKVHMVSAAVRDNPNLDYDNFRRDGENLFTDQEKSMLSRIGSLYDCVRLQRSVSGEDALYEKLMENAVKMISDDITGRKAIASKKKPVSALISSAANKTRV